MKDEPARLLAKAERPVRAAAHLLASGDEEFAAARAYYAMFYAAEALLSEKGLRFRKHGGVHARFGEHFVKTGVLDAKYHRWLLDAFDTRITADYGLDAEVNADEAWEVIERAREFVAETRRLLVRADMPPPAGSTDGSS